MLVLPNFSFMAVGGRRRRIRPTDKTQNCHLLLVGNGEALYSGADDADRHHQGAKIDSVFLFMI